MGQERGLSDLLLLLPKAMEQLWMEWQQSCCCSMG
jgi:hypothetical protein